MRVCACARVCVCVCIPMRAGDPFHLICFTTFRNIICIYTKS